MFIKINNRIINVDQLAHAQFDPTDAESKLVLHFGPPQQGNTEWPLTLRRQEAESVWRVLQAVQGLTPISQT